MSEDIGSYETDLVVVEKDIRQSFDEVHDLESGDRADKLTHIAARLYHAKQLLQTLRLEVGDVPVESRGQWQAVISQHSANLQRFDNLLVALRNDEKRQDLLEGRVQDADSLTPAQLIQQAARVQDESLASLGRSKNMVDKSREVGVITSEQLKRQSEQMGKVDTSIKDIRFHFDAARSQIKALTKRLETDKIFLSMLLLIFLGIVVIVVYKSFNPHSDLYVPKGFQPSIGYK